MGGGMCSGLNTNEAIEDCYERSKSEYGSLSDKFWPKHLTQQIKDSSRQILKRVNLLSGLK